VNNQSFDTDLIVFSSIRWDEDFQRLHHLMTRYAKSRRIYFFERPRKVNELDPSLNTQYRDSIQLLIPHIPKDYSPAEQAGACRSFLDDLIEREKIGRFCLWFNDPLALSFTDHLTPHLLIYDGFAHGSIHCAEQERILINKADVVLHPRNSEPTSFELTELTLKADQAESSLRSTWNLWWSRVVDLENSAMQTKSLQAKRYLNP
jgi:hypothetical protein